MSKALDGIRVIDFTHDQAGPACTQMLAWLGADVIKIERPPHGDRARRLWYSDRPDIDSYFFLLLNSNKRSAVINLKTDEGKEIARRLVREADVVAENLGPGVMDRLGLGYEAVGQLVEVAMQEAVLNITRVKFTPTLSNGRPLERMGNRSASGAYADRSVAPAPGRTTTST
jgi:crotonobetainyl-CoA:carnitine CoA-transferase CaiB-like acyl-CoA transferase